MKDIELVKDFSSKTTEIINQIKSCGDNISDKRITEKILRSLPQKFEHIVVVIEETKDLSRLSIHELMGSLEAHDQRVNQYSKQPMEQAFQIKANFSGRRGASFHHQRGGRSFYRRDSYGRAGESQNHSKGRSRSRGRGRANFQPRIGSNSYCSICKRTGNETQDCFYKCTRCKNSTHSVRNCWLKDKEDDYGENNTANFSKEKDQLFYSCMNVEHKEEEV